MLQYVHQLVALHMYQSIKAFSLKTLAGNEAVESEQKQ